MLLKKLLKIKKVGFPWVFYIQMVFGLILVFSLVFPFGIKATNVDQLKSEISKKSSEMRELEEEIETWEKEINIIGEEKQSLGRDLQRLDTTEKKLNSSIYLTSKQINTTGLKIEELDIEIDEKIEDISKNSAALAEAIRIINEQESYSFLETIFMGDSLSDVWTDLDSLQKVQIEIKDKTNSLRSLKAELVVDKGDSEERKEDLSSYKVELADQKEIVEDNQVVKSKLLTETKNKESNYQSILDEKKALRDKFEAELIEYEEALRLAVDPNSIPQGGRSILSWPVDSVYITQFFGNTPFATKNPQVYGSGGHNGVDFRASVGTKLKSVLSGTVVAVGNTDAACPGASYGKWVLIRHQNGLSSLYGHMSLIKVLKGQIVVTGDVIGYSGNTGYSTGPHLHLTIYATQGMRVETYNFRSCKGASTIMPLATKEAYLNPLSYLPDYKSR